MDQEEILDLVDDNDVVVGSKPRREVLEEGLSNFRVINAFIVNSKGELWIPRRTASKKMFPLCLDIGVGGHVESGMTYDETLKKEVQEEINLDIDTVPHQLLGKLHPKRDLVSAFMQVYEIRLDTVPDFNKEDFVEYYWFTPKAFFAHLVKGEKVKGDLITLVRKFYLH
jgi:isopentenyldiphosphate isomerase